MKVKFNQNLGTDDAKCCSLDASKCTIDALVDISDEAFQWLSRKYKGLLDVIEEAVSESKQESPEVLAVPADSIVGVATESQIKAPKKK